MIYVELPLEVQTHSKHYKINDNVPCNLALELKYGTSVEVFPMDKVSNVDFSEVSRSWRTPRKWIEVHF
jgi:Plus-3 domain